MSAISGRFIIFNIYLRNKVYLCFDRNYFIDISFTIFLLENSKIVGF